MSDLASRITDPNEGGADKPTVEVTPAEASSSDAAPASSGDAGQVDGTVEQLGGSGLQEPEWDVEVSLSDLQNNEATPFHSATTWQDLGL
jgi:ATP-dependent RNA helicase DDX19/DBP5